MKRLLTTICAALFGLGLAACDPGAGSGGDGTATTAPTE